MEKMDGLNIDRIAFLGWTCYEYLDIFDIDESLLGNGPILDCSTAKLISSNGITMAINKRLFH